jgi:hypothetical protein
MLIDDGVFSTIDNKDIPSEATILSSHFVLAIQRNADFTVKKYKARLVADGNRQPYWSYEETSSPTARSASVNLAFALAAIKKYKFNIFDVKGAYLKADIDHDIFLRLPAGVLGPDKAIVKLNKALYGLKQAGLLWNRLITSELIDLGYDQNKADKCVFIKND